MPEPPRPDRPRPVLAADLSAWAVAPGWPADPDGSTEQVAGRTARLVVAAAAADPQARERLERLLDEVGLDVLAELWGQAPAGSLARTLWVLHRLAAWCRQEGPHVAELYAAGQHRAEVSHVIAGAGEPPGPAEIANLADALLHGTWHGDLADACDRAAAFCRVVAAGRVETAEARRDLDPPGALARTDRLVTGGLRTAEELDDAAAAWRLGVLQ